MKQNTFKQGIDPKKQESKKLNPPIFEVELVNFHNPHIFWGSALVKAERTGVRK